MSEEKELRTLHKVIENGVVRSTQVNATPLELKHLLWMVVLILILNALFFPADKMAINHRISSKEDFYSPDSIILRMRKVDPRIVLLGNSMLGSGIDQKYFNDLTGIPTFKLYLGGSESAWWYLAFKNIICKSKGHITTVVIFFRDNELTDPGYRVTGNSKMRIDLLCETNEPVLDRLAYFNDMSDLDFMLSSHWPLYQKREALNSRIDSFMKGKTAKLSFNMSGKDLEEATKKIFADSNMDKELFTKYQFKADQLASAEFDFKNKVSQSFLPQIISLAGQNNIKLIFVRIKKRRDLIPNNQPAELLEYVKDLRAYFKKLDIALIDYTNDTHIQEKDYADGDHLDSKKSMIFTEMVADTISRIYLETGGK